MQYVDGFVLAVPTKNKQQYLEHCKLWADIFKEHGVLKMVECWGDEVPDGEQTSFIKAVKCKEDETVVFSWLIWPSKEARDAGMEKVMNDERLKDKEHAMPYDGKRMIFGGFTPIFEM